jgi:hypothetical protein
MIKVNKLNNNNNNNNNNHDKNYKAFLQFSEQIDCKNLCHSNLSAITTSLAP